jgi:hypothetical protein
VIQRHTSPCSAAGVRSSAPSTAGEIRPATLTTPVRAARAIVSTDARHRGITILHGRR